MAVTRIKNNQITDATITAAKIASQTLVGSLFATDLTFNSNISIVGNLTITGNSSNINAINTFITDPFVIFNNGYTGSLANYTIGILVNRNLASLANYGSVNTAWVWDENDGAFAGLTTTDTGVGITTINNSGYANVKVGNLVATHSVTATNYNISQANVIDAKVTTLVATNFSTGNAVISGGYISALANVTVTTGNAATWYTTNLNSTNGNITTLTATTVDAGTTTTAVLNSTTGNITTLTGTTFNVGTTTTAILNSTSGNVTTLATTNFSSGNAQIASGYADNFPIGANTAAPGTFTTVTATTVNAGTTTTATLNSTTGNITTLGAGTTTTAALNSTNGNITTLEAGTTTTATLNSTTGNITTLTSTTVNAGTTTTATLNSTTGNITTLGVGTTTTATLNSTTGNITTLTSTTVNAGTTTTATLNATTGNISTLGVGTTTTAVLNTSTANVTNGSAGTLAVTNFSSGNSVITGGSANSFKVGNTTPESGAFTTLSSSGLTTFTNATQSDNATTGAVVVTGGVGIGANLNVAGNVTVLGNLLVQGNTTTLNVETLNVEDLNITVAANATSGAEANGAGLTVAGANATLTYLNADDSWNVNKKLNTSSLVASGNIVAASGTTSATYTTGAIVVPGNGGVGIGGNLNVRGTSDFTGNITAGNILVSGNINVTVGAVASSYGIFYGNAGGIGALYAGTTTYTALPTTVLQMTADVDSYGQVNFQNRNTGISASTDYVATADNGDDNDGYINLGINSSTFADPDYPGYYPSDGYLIMHGFEPATGNLNIHSHNTGSVIKLIVGSFGDSNVRATVTNTGFRVNTATASISTTTGALLVDGGAGIKGNIHAAAINATPIGNTTPSTGAFTTLTGTSAALTTLVATNFSTANAVITGGSMDGVEIGDTTPTTGKFTTITATTVDAGTTTTATLNSTTGNIATLGAGTTTTATLNSTTGNITTLGASTTTTATLNSTNGNITTLTSTTVNAGTTTTAVLNNTTANITSGAATTFVATNFSSGNAQIASGYADNFPIGANTAAPGRFTTVVATGVTTSAGNIVANSGTASTNTTSGALVLTGTGGAGIGGNLNVGQSAIFNTTKTANYDFIVRGDNDDTLIWARPSSTYDSVVIGNSATTSTLITGAKLIVNTTDSIMVPVGTTAQRPGSAGGTDTAGMIRFNTSTGELEYYDGAEWNNTGTTFTVIAADSFDGDDITTIFTLGAAATTNSCIVSINGVVQIPAIAYSVSGTTLTFTSPPATGDKIDVRRLTTTSTITILQSQNGYVAADAQNDSLIISAGTSSLVERLRIHTNGNINASGSLITTGTITGSSTITAQGNLVAAATTASTSTTTGALVVSGGAGISGVLNVGGNIVATATTTSTNTTTGALVVRGGAGFAGNINTAGWIIPSANVSQNLGTSTQWWNTFYGVSTQAQYADLAENYQADQLYPAGTVLEFGGQEEVTVAMTESSTRVAGIVSSNPAHLMNGGLRGSNVVALALIGRVPCNVIGPVAKGDMMVSAGYGYARASAEPKLGSVIGKALQNFEGDKGTIEVVVGRV
jgi:trimeric autotransporter adhesin